MISVNCAAVPRELLEAEFFGAERGAYTGAVVRKIGKVELASGGTFFLDEIGELHGELQAKLLRVLQERTFMRVGGVAEIHADIRVVAASNQDLARAVEKGAFREDLYYRLNVFPIRLPPLRERPEDVVPLARKFLAMLAERQGCAPPELPAATQAFLTRAPWPGNVRELRNAIERATILAGGEKLEPAHFGSLDGAGGDRRPAHEGMTLLEVGRLAQRRAESEAIRRALKETAGNRTEAARRLGVSYKTLWAKLKEYEIR
jgi:transcriptional regulator with PAS, ATPase and Fis domain